MVPECLVKLHELFPEERLKEGPRFLHKDYRTFTSSYHGISRGSGGSSTEFHTFFLGN